MRPTNATTLAPWRGSTLTLLLAGAMLISVLAISGCNTVSGIGEDISAAGKGIDQSSEATQEGLTGKQRAQGDQYKAGPY